MKLVKQVLLSTTLLSAALFARQISAQIWSELDGGVNITDENYCNISAVVCDTNGNVYIAGDFETAGGLFVNRIAKWDGASWSDLDGGVDGGVDSLALDSNGNLYAGGWFSDAGGVAASHIAKWDGSSWSSLGSGLNGPVGALAADRRGNIYAVGTFTMAGSVAANYIAKWDGFAWSGFTNGINDNYEAAENGARDLSFDPDNNLYVAGPFTNAGNMTVNGIAKAVLPDFSASPTLLSYSGTFGDANPAPQEFAITNVGLAALDFTSAITYSAGASGWFTPSLLTGHLEFSGSFTVTGTVNIAGVAVGTHYATNTITSPGALNSPQIVVAKLTVGPPPGLGADPTNITRSIWQGQDAGSNLVEVWNTNGTGALNFTTTVSYVNCGTWTNWLSVVPDSGTSHGEYQKAWLRMDTALLPVRADAYEGQVLVEAQPPASGTPKLVRVLVYVQGASLWVSPAVLVKEVTEGQTSNAWDVIKVANTGSPPRGVISYSVTATSQPTAWLGVTPPDGNVQDGTNSLVAEYKATGLEPGWHTGRIEVASINAGTHNVEVLLQVNHRPAVAWNALSRKWTNSVMAGRNLGATTIEVWNASASPSGNMRYEISVINDSFGWVSVSPASGFSSGERHGAKVSYSTAGLSPGIYTAQLRLSGTDFSTGQAAANSPLLVGLKLTVHATPVLKTDRTRISKTVLQHHTGTEELLVWNASAAPRGGMRWTTVSDVRWASVIPWTGVANGNASGLTIKLGSMALASGVYKGSIKIYASDTQSGAPAVGSPLVIPLVLTVTSRSPLNLEKPTVTGKMFIGQRIAANVGLWRNQGRLTFGYQWERASTKSGAGRQVISGATSAGYTIKAADRGKYLRVKVTARDAAPYLMSASAYSDWADAAKVRALRHDFNGDGVTDLWVYEDASGMWHANFGTANSASLLFGTPGMFAATGDFDGDGYEDLGLYESAHGMWHVLYLPRCEYVNGSLFGGTIEESEAMPVVGDYDGDGASDVALYWKGYWAIRHSGTKSVVVLKPFASGGVPVVGDWEGDAMDNPGIYNNGTWTLLMGDGKASQQSFGGGRTSVPVTEDFDGDGAADLGIYDVYSNLWRWRESRTGFTKSLRFGQGGTMPAPGHYDHDSLADWAQIRLAEGNDFIIWEIKRTGDATFPYLGQSFQRSTGRWRVSW